MRDPNEIVPMPRFEQTPPSYGFDELLQQAIETHRQQTRETIPTRAIRGIFRAAITGFEAIADAPYPTNEDAEASLLVEQYTLTPVPGPLVAHRAAVMRSTWWRQVRQGVTRPFRDVRASLQSTHPPVDNAARDESMSGGYYVEARTPQTNTGWLQRLAERLPSPFGPEDRG